MAETRNTLVLKKDGKNQANRRASRQLLGMFLAFVICACIEYPLIFFWLNNVIPNDPWYWILARVGVYFLLFLVITIIVRKSLGAIGYEWHIFNAEDGTFNVVMSLFSAIFLETGLYSIFIATANSYLKPDFWTSVLYDVLIYIVVKSIAAIIAYICSLRAAAYTNRKVRDVAHRVEDLGGRLSYGQHRVQHKPIKNKK
jgi:hypothetical protein